MRANGLLAPLRHEWLPSLTNLDARFRAPAWDPALQWGVPYMWNGTGIVYNRSLQPRARALGRPVESAPEGPPHHAGRSRGHAGRVPQEARPALQRHRPARTGAAPSRRPSRRSRCCAPTSTPKCATSWWRATCWPRSSGPPRRSRPSMPRRTWRSSIRRRAFRSTAIARSSCARAAASRLAHQFLDYLLRPAVSARIVEATRTATANGAARRRCCPSPLRRTPSALSAARGLRAGRMAAHARPRPRSGCATASGRRSSRHDGAWILE